MLVFYLVCALGAAAVHALPEVKVRGTTISGRDISNVEFFGGQLSEIYEFALGFLTSAF
jgi:hypothetical protein